MKKLNCSDTFIEYQKKRLSHPLTRGVYKLDETASRQEACQEEIERIKDYKLNKGYPTMMHCVREDAHIWLKRIPHMISENMGYSVVPAISALSGDDVPQILVAKLKKTYLPLINSLIFNCNSYWVTSKKDAKEEYLRWSMGESNLTDLLDESIDIIDRLLIDAGHPR
jgi:hypothetical protein